MSVSSFQKKLHKDKVKFWVWGDCNPLVVMNFFATVSGKGIFSHYQWKKFGGNYRTFSV